jgi:hypothetical protein
MFVSADKFIKDMEDDEECAFCGHTRKSHHKDCFKCFSIPSTHGHYCENFLCCCIEFMEPELSDEDIAALMGETA